MSKENSNGKIIENNNDNNIGIKYNRIMPY